MGGSDLTDIGLAGAEIGRALARIRAGFLDGEIANREEALALAEELARRAARRNAPKKAKPQRRGAKRGKVTGKRPRRVAGAGAIADTPADRRRASTSPGSASPQADQSR